MVIQNCSSVQHDDWIIPVVLQSGWDSTRGITVVNFVSKAILLVFSIYNFGWPVRIYDNKGNSVSRPMI
jgi:hypothetical protein